MWIITIVLILFYYIILIVLGPAKALPVPGALPDMHGLTFLLLITFNFFLLFLFVLSLKKKIFAWMKQSKTIPKLIAFHAILFIVALLVPIIIFIGLYLVAYFIWYLVSALFLILFSRELSIKISGKFAIKGRSKGILTYIIWWFVLFTLFGVLFLLFNWTTLNINQLMILLIFPLFIIIVPIFGLLVKPKSGIRPPLTLFGLLISLVLLYNWMLYLNWTQQNSAFTFLDAGIDLVIISYSFFTLFKNARVISARVNNKIQIDQLLFLFVWTRISSMILLLTAMDFEILGFTAAEGSYLATMFLIFIVGFIQGIIWARKGLMEKEIQ